MRSEDMRKKEFGVDASKSGWKPYVLRWGINLPLHPKCERIPFFVGIAQDSAIIDRSPTIEVPRPGQKFSKNKVLRMARSTLIVDWTRASQELLSNFRLIMRIQKYNLAHSHLGLFQHLKMIEDKRTHWELLPKYLKVYDLKEKRGMTFRGIAEKLYGREHPGANEQRAKERYYAAKDLVEGGYITLGSSG